MPGFNCLVLMYFRFIMLIFYYFLDILPSFLENLGEI